MNQRKQKCVILTRTMSISGGLPEAVRQLVIANEQSSHRWYFRVLVQKDFTSQEIPAGLCHTVFDRLKGTYLHSILQTWRASSRKNADRIVATDFRLFLVALIAWTIRLRSPRDVTFWIHGISLVIDGVIKRWIFQFAGTISTLVFASLVIRQAHWYPWHQGHSHVVLNGVQDHRFRADRIGEDRPLVLQYTAAFIGLKNHQTLLKAFAKVIATNPAVELRLLGDGETRPTMENLSEELGIASHVQFMGRRNDARELLGSCDLYVHPSIGEGLGIAVVEAMFAGLPIVAADSGAFPEYLEHNSSAWLVNCEDDGQALSEAILEMINRIEDGRAIDMGKTAISEASKRFDTSRYIAEWQDAVDSGRR